MPPAREHGTTVPVPIVMPHMKVVKVHVPTPGMSYVGDAGRIAAGYLPPPERLMFYGGLGIAAVAGLIEWPVAAAVGIGTALARRASRDRSGRPRVRTTGGARAVGATAAEGT